MPNRNAATKRRQAESLVVAKNWGQPWRQREIELVMLAAPAHEVAGQLGRSVYAIQSARHLLAQGITLGGGHKPRPADRVRAMCACHGLEVTALGECALA